jgi:hypothetical protein
MNNTKLFNGIKDVIIDWLVPHTKHVAQLGGSWAIDSDAGSFSWLCDINPSNAHSNIGAYLWNDEIRIWTNNEQNINFRIYYNTAISNAPIVAPKTDSKHEDFSENDIQNLYIKIKEYLEKNKELAVPSNGENSKNLWGRYIKEQIIRTFDQSKFNIGKCYEVREINQNNPKLVFPCQCLLQSVYDTELVFLYLKEDGVSNVFSINIQDINNYEILEMFTTH